MFVSHELGMYIFICTSDWNILILQKNMLLCTCIKSADSCVMNQEFGPKKLLDVQKFLHPRWILAKLLFLSRIR